MKTCKHGNIGIISILTITALLLSACTLYLNEQGDAGTVTVNITIGGNATVDWLDGLTPGDLVHTIQLLDENGEEQYRKENLRYGQKSSFSVTPGLYTFYVEAFYNGELKATGWAERTIHAGKNPDITIQMEPAIIRTLTGITVKYTPDPDNTIFTDTTHDTLKEGLTVTAYYSDGTTAHVTNYTLSVEGGEFTVGENTVTVHYTEGGVTKTDTFTVNVFPTHEHNWRKISETPPTCTTAGTEIWECDAIDSPHHENRPGADIDPDAHLWNDNYEVTIPATCSATGIEEDTCSYNHLHTRTQIIDIDPDKHNYIWTTTTSATCIAEGEETGICSHNNNHTTTRTIQIDLIYGHDYQNWTETIAPTCSEVGKEEAPCERDGTHEKGVRDIPIVPNAHTWGSWSLTQPNKGISTRICSNNTHTQASNEMVFVPGGTFQLGKDLGEAAVADVTPISNVTLSDFYIGKFEVTQAQWIALMGASPIVTGPMYPEGDAKPVYYINWYRTLVFCNRLSISEGLVPAYRINNSTNPNDWGAVPTGSNAVWNNVTIAVSNGYRLLTEAQWEYAAKGGNPLAPGWVGYTYAGGDDPDEVAWLVSDPVTAREVGTKAPNFLGIYDMTGSVAEWCWDWHGDYTGEDKTDPTGASSGTNRELRGGSWYWTEANARSTGRISYAPQNSYTTLGFRVARPAGEMEGLGDITALVWNEGNAVSLTAPAVYVASGNTVNAQGWQISDDGTSGWTNFTATTAAISLNGKYLRYYAAINGTTYYSNTVTIKVIPTGSREVTIDMLDNTLAGGTTGDGWNGNAALRIVVNGTDLAAVKVETNAANNTPSGQRASNTYAFFAYPNDVVQLYWVAGSLDQGNAFIAYYTDTPPDPTFTSANSNSYAGNAWDGSNALVFRLSGTNYLKPTLNNVPDGTLLGSFTVTLVNAITAPTWRDGNAPSLAAPTVIGTPTAQGWQISEDGTSGWTNFTAATAAMSHNGRYLRYYATVSGVTCYSNTVTIKVLSSTEQEVTIDMFDSGNDGWDGTGALRIVVNGTELATGVKAAGAGSTYTFYVDTGDVVELYWVAGAYQQENSFIAYYADTPPVPAFTASNNSSWDGTNALVFRLRGFMNSIAGGDLLGSFTVP